VINYRFGGLAEKILETHQIVLAKRSKDRVRSTKWLGWDLCVEVGSLQGVICRFAKTQETKLRLKGTQGPNSKINLSSSTFAS
jgi:hypothetical protein